MAKRRIFISSVQDEFSIERQALADYILADPLLGKFFEPFIFEQLPAMDQRADKVYLREIEFCDIYLGLLGKKYGYEDDEGISPTEKEFDHATLHHKYRLVFLAAHNNDERHEKELKLISKVQDVLIRKQFSTAEELKSSVYAALVRYLEEKEIIRTGPFDATLHAHAGIDELDSDKIRNFVHIARSKRGFRLQEEAPVMDILTHLNLTENGRLTHASLLLFAKEPQRYFINSEVRCAHFHGKIVEKPIPSYQVFKGTVFELADQTVDFILSKLDYAVGTREKEIQIPGGYEIPREIIAEAVVNAIAHRDYTDNGSVQVMLFSDRLEIWNPGSLPLGWTPEKLKRLHASVPANPLLAEPMYLAGYIERLGTGTADMVRLSADHKLKEPEFIQDENFKVIIYRPAPVDEATDQPTDQPADQPTDQAADQVKALVLKIEKEHSRHELMKLLDLKHNQTFRDNYLNPSLAMGYIEMTNPEAPNHPNQKYRLTAKGLAFQKIVKDKNATK